MLSLLRSFFGCLASAVRYLHRARIRHRDIKPQNILVKADRVLLADFGIAYSWENLHRATTTADSGKTLIYAAPEVVRVEPRNESADVWSLGCVFLEMVVVIKGGTVDEMRREWYAKSEGYCFHANCQGIGLLLAGLRDCGQRTDNVVLGWVKGMLERMKSERPTAATLFEDIVMECARSKIPFCGPCCYDDAIGSGSEEEEEEEEEDNDVWAEALRDG